MISRLAPNEGFLDIDRDPDLVQTKPLGRLLQRQTFTAEHNKGAQNEKPSETSLSGSFESQTLDTGPSVSGCDTPVRHLIEEFLSVLSQVI